MSEPDDDGAPIPIYGASIPTRGPDDQGSAVCAYGVAPMPLGFRYAGLSTPHEDTPIFTLHDVLEIMDGAHKMVRPTMHAARHVALDVLKVEFEKQMRAALQNEIDAFIRSRR